MTNDRNRFAAPVFMVRLLAAAACLGLCVMIGCGNLGAGCNGGSTSNDNSPAGNDNIADNDNGDVGNDNEPENDNGENDNGGTANGNANQNLNDNLGGPGGNDNSAANDNGTANTNDNVVSNSNQNGNANANGNLNGNANTNANGNVNGNTNSNDNTTGGGGGGPVCGNGVPESGEQCDDGNTFNTDACLNNCQAAVCGDRFVRTGVEECDDGNATPDDGCNNSCQMVATKSSGAAQPGDVVTLSLDEDLPGTSCEFAAIWTQNPADTVQVALTDGGLACASLGEGCAFFIAPAVAMSMNLRFTVNSPAVSCIPVGAQTGSQTVPIQVANLTFNLPLQIRLNTPLDLDQSSITTVTGAPAERLLFFFAQDPLPADVEVDICNQPDPEQPSCTSATIGVMTVTAGVGRTITVIAQVTAQSGMLAEETDTILIVP